MPLRKKSYENSEQLVNQIVNLIYEKKGNNIVSLKFTPEIANFCDYFVICDAENPIQARAISDHIEIELKKIFGIYPEHIEGYENAEWILLDYIDVVVHIFVKEKREFYALEKLWADTELKTYFQEETN